MNRRTFLSTAGAAAAGLSVGGFSTTRKLFAQTAVDPTLINNAVNTHAQSVGNFYNNVGGFDDLYAMSGACENLATHFNDTGLNAQFIQYAQQVTAAQINFNNLDLNTPTARVQNYAPAFQVSDAQSLMSNFSYTQADIANALTKLQTTGISPFLSSASAKLQMMATSIAPPGSTRNSEGPLRRQNTEIQTATYYPNQRKAHSQDVVWRPFMTLPSEGGGSTPKYSCKQDAQMYMGFNAEALIIGIFCYGGGVTGLVCTPILGVISFGWGAAHTVICGWG